MIHPVRNLAGGLVLAVLLLGGGPASAAAASLNFRNDTSMAVIVRGASVINRVLRLGPPHLLQPGETCSDPILFPGDKLITIYDAKQPSRQLFQDRIRCGATDLFFAIKIVEPRGEGPKTQKPTGPAVKLEPVSPPAPRKR